MTTTPLPSPQEDGGNTFVEKLKALASKESLGILRCLASHKPTPVPIHVISEELGMTRYKTSDHLTKLRKVQLVHMQGRRRGYFADTAQLRSVIGEQNYTRITQELYQNEDAPGQSQD